jgi:hypothetical protein
VLTQTQPPGTLGCAPNQQSAGQIVLRSQTYEITFTGQAGSALRAEFDDCKVSIGPGTTALRAELPDQGALTGLINRITGLGLEVVDLHLITPTKTMTDLPEIRVRDLPAAGLPCRAASWRVAGGLQEGRGGSCCSSHMPRLLR